MRLARLIMVGIGVGLFGAGCVTQPAGPYLCSDPPNPCNCEGAADRGAVVVRWRLADTQAGKLYGRSECCCIPDAAPPSLVAGQQCKSTGSRCAQSPAWLVRLIQLHITSVETGQSCVLSTPCTAAELSTDYCLPPGLYDLQVTADVDVYDSSCQQFVCGNRPAISPPSVRRRIIAGQTVNLEGVVLGVNPPSTYSDVDAGAQAGRCSMALDGGSHE